MCGASSELLLVFFSLSSVDDKHDIRNSDTGLSNVGGQDNLPYLQNRKVFKTHLSVELCIN